MSLSNLVFKQNPPFIQFVTMPICIFTVFECSLRFEIQTKHIQTHFHTKNTHHKIINPKELYFESLFEGKGATVGIGAMGLLETVLDNGNSVISGTDNFGIGPFIKSFLIPLFFCIKANTS